MNSPSTTHATTADIHHDDRPTVVLVHGAWADSSSWTPVATELHRLGYAVLAPPNPLRGVAADAAYLSSFLDQRTTGPVVLVGHSYGGVVVTNVSLATADIVGLVYVDAFIPQVGETMLDILGGSGSALDVADPTTVLDIAGYPGAPQGDAEAFLKPAVVHESFAQDLPESDRRLIAAGQRPLALSATGAPTVSAAWQHVPSWTVIGTEDRVIPAARQRSMAARAGSTVSEVGGSHLSMLSHPNTSITAILAAAGLVGVR